MFVLALGLIAFLAVFIAITAVLRPWSHNPSQEELEDLSRNKLYETLSRAKIYPHWASPDRISYFEIRTYEAHKRGFFYPPDHPTKSEAWQITSSLAGEVEKETFLFVTTQSMNPFGYFHSSEGSREIPNILLQSQGNSIFMSWSGWNFIVLEEGKIRVKQSPFAKDRACALFYNAIKGAFLYLNKDLNLVYGPYSAEPIKSAIVWNHSEGFTEVPLREFEENKERYRGRETGMISEESDGRKTVTVYTRPPRHDGELFQKLCGPLLEIDNKIYAFCWEGQAGLIQTYCLPLKPGSDWTQLGPPVKTEKPGFGISLSPNGQYIAIGGVGIFRFTPHSGLEAKVSGLDLIYPSWSPSGTDLVAFERKKIQTEIRIKEPAPAENANPIVTVQFRTAELKMSK